MRKGSYSGKLTHCHQKREVSVKTEVISALNTSKMVAKIPGVSSELLPTLVPVAWQHFLFQSLLHRISCVSGINKPHVRIPSKLNSTQGNFVPLSLFFFFYHVWKLMVSLVLILNLSDYFRLHSLSRLISK